VLDWSESLRVAQLFHQPPGRRVVKEAFQVEFRPEFPVLPASSGASPTREGQPATGFRQRWRRGSSGTGSHLQFSF
jgi:hypothetical protein